MDDSSVSGFGESVGKAASLYLFDIGTQAIAALFAAAGDLAHELMELLFAEDPLAVSFESVGGETLHGGLAHHAHAAVVRASGEGWTGRSHLDGLRGRRRNRLGDGHLDVAFTAGGGLAVDVGRVSVRVASRRHLLELGVRVRASRLIHGCLVR